MIYDPVIGDPDSEISAAAPFNEIPDDWTCPIWGAEKKLFVSDKEPAAA